MSNENVSNSTELVQREPKKILTVMAENLSVPNPNELYEVLENTACKGFTKDQIKMFCIVANMYQLNPLTGEIYASVRSNGQLSVGVSVDGWARLINEHPQFLKMEIELPEDGKSCTCKIWRKDREVPTVITEYLSDNYRSDSAAWKHYPKRMLRHKAVKECARLALGFSGLYDKEEIEIIREQEREERQEKKNASLAERLKAQAEAQDAEFEIKENTSK